MTLENFSENNSETVLRPKTGFIKSLLANANVWLFVSIGLFLLAAVLAAVIGYTVLGYVRGLEQQNSLISPEPSAGDMLMSSSTSEELSQPTPSVSRLLDGEKVEMGRENPLLYAVMIENHADSRPPAGLSAARLVYEAEAEGGITRFLAVYPADAEISKIGPVRSARPYYIDWALTLDALYVHCGGSPEALEMIRNGLVKDMNEFYLSAYFWRDKDRSAPHNVYTSSTLISQYISDRKIASSTFSSWIFKDDAATDLRATNSQIHLPFKSPLYFVDWKFDPLANEYARWQGGAEHADEDGSLVKAKNVIIQIVSSMPTDEKGRLEIKTSGSGRAIVCRDGFCQEAVWTSGNQDRTEFQTDAGQAIELNAGITWVEAVPKSKAAQIQY